MNQKKNQFIEKISFDHNVDAQWMKKKQKLQLELEVDKKKIENIKNPTLGVSWDSKGEENSKQKREKCNGIK